MPRSSREACGIADVAVLEHEAHGPELSTRSIHTWKSRSIAICEDLHRVLIEQRAVADPDHAQLRVRGHRDRDACAQPLGIARLLERHAGEQHHAVTEVETRHRHLRGLAIASRFAWLRASMFFGERLRLVLVRFAARSARPSGARARRWH
jgi:hypothetical protein